MLTNLCNPTGYKVVLVRQAPSDGIGQSNLVSYTATSAEELRSWLPLDVRVMYYVTDKKYPGEVCSALSPVCPKKLTCKEFDWKTLTTSFGTF